MWHYGFKGHFVVIPSGYIVNYVITPAAIHDAREAPELIRDCPRPFILAGAGYLGTKLQEQFRQQGDQLWTPYRSNMAGAKKHNKDPLKSIRRTIESRFAILAQEYGIERNIARSLTGFQVKIECVLLVYNLGYFDIETN
ncbi:hypothetical protein IGI37_000787 [Enterococcus sp. AZ194]